MSDFHQGGVITTLHRLGPSNLDVLERDLEKSAGFRPIALVLPCLGSELDTESIPHIIEELQQVRYLEEIVVALGRASHERFVNAKRLFRQLPTRTTVVWIESTPVQGLLQEMEQRGLAVKQDGKGRSAWMAYGPLQPLAREWIKQAFQD